MATINPEMLKQLLAEFEEKEAVTQEEIKAIQEQIKELELRIDSSRVRLESVAKDRQKVAAMKARYAEGDWSSVLNELKDTKTTNGRSDLGTVTGDTPVISLDNQAQGISDRPAASEFPMEQPAAFPAQTQSAPAAEAAPPAPAAPLEATAYAQYQPAAEAQPPAQPPAPAAAPPAEGGLFPFSQNPQPDAQPDIPWAPPPSMTWESVSSHSAFPSEGGGFPPQQYQQPPAPQALPAPNPPAGAPYGDPNQQYLEQMQQAAPQPMPMATDPNQQPPFAQNAQVLSKDFDEEFDISEALRGDEDPSQDKGGENDKKIKDALRGLFS